VSYCYDCAANVQEPCGPDCLLGDDNRPMAQTNAEKQKAFKDSMREAGYVRLEAWVTEEQRKKFRQIGSDEWLRKRIDAAKPPLPLYIKER
jgi:hypothetical protein